MRRHGQDHTSLFQLMVKQQRWKSMINQLGLEPLYLSHISEPIHQTNLRTILRILRTILRKLRTIYSLEMNRNLRSNLDCRLLNQLYDVGLEPDSLSASLIVNR